MGYGLFGGNDNTGLLLAILGLGAVLVFVSVSMFSPLFSSPSASFLGLPLDHLPENKITGHMARKNAAKNNKRTASTAAGLMIGLALIAMATVVATSLKESFKAELGSTLTADYLVTAPNQATFSNRLATRSRRSPNSRRSRRCATAMCASTAPNTKWRQPTSRFSPIFSNVDVTSGDPAASADADHVLIHTTWRRTRDSRLATTDRRVRKNRDARTHRRRHLRQLVPDRRLHHGSVRMGRELHVGRTTRSFRQLAPGVDIAAADAALAPLEAPSRSSISRLATEFRESVEGQLDSLLVVINVFLGLAIVIALLGITNTMALSVLERTRRSASCGRSG